MHDDLKLAFAVEDGTLRALKTLQSRFSDELELALEHCRIAVELGLKFDEYSVGVLQEAAGSLLRSYPVGRGDASLDPHVARILSHRDFALALLLRRSVPDAWRVFVQRFGGYVRSLFMRHGQSFEAAQTELEKLITTLGDDSKGPAPIAGYRGSVDLNNWLYCFIRAQEPMPDTGTPDVLPIVNLEHGYVLPLVLNEKELRKHIHHEFAEVWRKLRKSDRHLMESFAFGLPANQALARGGDDERTKTQSTRPVFERHALVVKTLAHALRKAVVGHYRGLVSATVIEEAIINIVTGDLVKKLVPIVRSNPGKLEDTP